MEDLWNYRSQSDLGSNVTDTHTDLTGFKVEALDGSIGSIDEATYVNPIFDVPVVNYDPQWRYYLVVGFTF